MSFLKNDKEVCREAWFIANLSCLSPYAYYFYNYDVVAIFQANASDRAYHIPSNSNPTDNVHTHVRYANMNRYLREKRYIHARPDYIGFVEFPNLT